MFRMLSILDRSPIGVQKMLGWTLLRLMPLFTLTLTPHFSWEIQKRFISWPLLPEKLCRSVWSSGASIWKNSMTYFLKEYLLSLREQSKNLFQVDYNNVIKVGDVVVVKNPMKSRPYWSSGKVMEVTPGDDGIVRSTNIRKPNSVSDVLAPTCPKRSTRGMLKKDFLKFVWYWFPWICCSVSVITFFLFVLEGVENFKFGTLSARIRLAVWKLCR